MAHVIPSHALVVALTATGPSAGESVVVPPLSVEGTLDEPAVAQLDGSLVDGLARGGFSVSEARPAAFPDPCDQACWEELTAGADLVVRARVVVEARVYRIEVAAYDPQGKELARAEDLCEVCGRSDVAEMVAAQGARLRRRLDLLADESVEPASKPEPAPPAVVPPTSAPQPDVVPRRPDRRVVWGGLATGAGAVGIAAGVALLVVHGRPYRAACSGNDVDFAGRCRNELNTLAGGITGVTVGVGLVATGVALLVRARRRPR